MTWHFHYIVLLNGFGSWPCWRQRRNTISYWILCNRINISNELKCNQYKLIEVLNRGQSIDIWINFTICIVKSSRQILVLVGRRRCTNIHCIISNHSAIWRRFLGQLFRILPFDITSCCIFVAVLRLFPKIIPHKQTVQKLFLVWFEYWIFERKTSDWENS